MRAAAGRTRTSTPSAGPTTGGERPGVHPTSVTGTAPLRGCTCDGDGERDHSSRCGNGRHPDVVRELTCHRPVCRTGRHAGRGWQLDGPEQERTQRHLRPGIRSRGRVHPHAGRAGPCPSVEHGDGVGERGSGRGPGRCTTVCDVGGPVGLFASWAAPDAGGSWTDANNNAFSGTYDPAVNARVCTPTITGTAPARMQVRR